jgi:hypothetical protein
VYIVYNVNKEIIKSKGVQPIPNRETNGLASLDKSGVKRKVQYASYDLESKIQLVVIVNLAVLFMD